jgi:glycosyltransferase involved in cell wall biosynthesis
MTTGMVSIIVPIYKAEDFLENSVNSIRTQTYTNLEIILVNDGSPDKCGEMCDSFAREDNRIKVIHKTNGGAANAMNAGLDLVKGEFVAFVASDDTIDADMIERMYKRIDESGADICISGYKMIYADYTRLVKVPHEEKLSPSELWDAHIKNFRTYFTLSTLQCNKLIRTAILNLSDSKVIRINENLHNSEDAWFFADCAENAKNGIVYVDTTPYNYMLASNPLSISKSASYEDMNKFMDHLQDIMLRALPEQSEEIKKTITCQKYATMMVVTHIAIINRKKPSFKMKWLEIKTILRNSTSKEEKLSAFLIYFMPKPLYRAAFKFYGKRSNL